MQGLHRDLACSLVTVSPRPCREPLLGEHKSVCSMQVGTELAARFGCCFLSTIQTAWLCVPQRKAGLRHCIPRWDFPLQGPFHLKTPTKAQPVSLARPAAAGAWGPRLFSPPSLVEVLRVTSLCRVNRSPAGALQTRGCTPGMGSVGASNSISSKVTPIKPLTEGHIRSRGRRSRDPWWEVSEKGSVCGPQEVD